MHWYASDARGTHLIYLYLAVIAVIAAWLLEQAAVRLNMRIPWWIDTPAVLGFYGLVWKWFDVQLWRVRAIQRLGFLSMPDLRGTWDARADYFFDGDQKCTLGTATIHQTWSRLSLTIVWERSRSYSVAGIVQRGVTANFELIYQYVNEPDVHAVTTMHIHRGTGWLTYDATRRILEGEYFSGRGRQQVGKLHLERKAVDAAVVRRHGG